MPEERVVFTGDTIFSACQTWLMTSDVDQRLAALERIKGLDVDHVIPGHGPVVTKAYLDTQRSVLLEWKSAVATAVGIAGRATRRLPGGLPGSLRPGRHRQGYMMDHIQTLNAASLYDKLTRPAAVPAR